MKQRQKRSWNRSAAGRKFRNSVFATQDQIAADLPDVDPGDLLKILSTVLRPFGTGRRFFARSKKAAGRRKDKAQLPILEDTLKVKRALAKMK